MKTHLKPIDSRTGPDLDGRLDVQAQCGRRVDANATLPEGRRLSARPPVRRRTDPRGDSRGAHSSMRDAPPPYNSRTASAPLVHARRPSRRPASPTPGLPVRPSGEASDSGRGLALFLIFVAAVLVMVLAVWLAAAVGEWWILPPVVAVDLIVTAVVMSVLIWMLADGANPAQTDIRSLTAVPGLEREPDGNESTHEPAHAA